MSTFPYKSTAYFTLDPHVKNESGVDGLIPINTIATRVYGKPYNSLRGCQRDDENLPNHSVVLYNFADEDDFEEELGQFDETNWYLGYNRETREGVYKRGMTEMQYWMTITVAEHPGDATVDANPPEGTDLEGAVFPDQNFADRAFTPSLGGVIADLIRRGELPRGNYIYRHWW